MRVIYVVPDEPVKRCVVRLAGGFAENWRNRRPPKRKDSTR